MATGPSRYGHRLHGGGSSAAMASQHDLMGSVAIVDDHDAIHAAVELWCGQAQPPIRFIGKYFSAEQFLDEHPSPSASGVGPVVLELRMERNGVDYAALDRIVSRRHRVIVYSHIATDEVILTALDRGAVTYLTKSESKSHLIDAIRAARNRYALCRTADGLGNTQRQHDRPREPCAAGEGSAD